ncbi:MAG: hypothetical protein SNF33_00850 [Candidatus Algichlamydia australiensis]|nr:hypothetical protein [Chlamydiales bacterium]
MNVKKMPFFVLLVSCAAGLFNPAYGINETENPLPFYEEDDSWTDLHDESIKVADDGQVNNCGGYARLEHIHVGGNYGSRVYVVNQHPTSTL